MLFNKKIEPSCAYCRFGSVLGYDEIICIKRGVMESSGCCSSFRYEPTKRVPSTSPDINVSGLSEEDFSL